MKHCVRLAAATLGIGIVGACAAPGDAWESSIADFAFDSNTQVAFAPASITQALPNTVYALSDGSERRVSDAVVRGDFISSVPARAMDWDSGEEVGWDDDAAQTRTVKATFAVSEVVAAANGIDVSDVIDVFVTVYGDADADAVGEGLVDAGESVLFVRQHWDPDFSGGWAIAQNGSLVMTVGNDDTLELPVYAEQGRLAVASTDEQSHDEQLEHDLTTLTSLRSAAGEPDTVVDAE